MKDKVLILINMIFFLSIAIFFNLYFDISRVIIDSAQMVNRVALSVILSLILILLGIIGMYKSLTLLRRSKNQDGYVWVNIIFSYILFIICNGLIAFSIELISEII